ncbi:MAG TPA: efflux RND transporter periplasmic adaptor subunit [Dinghuibacter sp.]|jgi:membrane fusion protein (multidrug efflux system)|uniref:efflux RND transporter periplasmic adaptor subunit n=1 Tax=Dinghuibacter sp. TaxID=2024697 RepID=UPI002CD94B9A|nr:efflux RND transporter periplasmic adaptor subunit [Dinghuibacter sp.]HTJ11291.1 efflux RND transporter periplasmic adaptor subunit [Dinghuibacter sp.]
MQALPHLSVAAKVAMGICALAALTACHDQTTAKTAAAAPPIVDVIIAKTQAVSNPVEASGTVVANQSVALQPETSGRLIYLNVPEGKLVGQGTIIARINDSDLVAQQNKTKLSLDLAIQTRNRLEKLLAINGINQTAFDTMTNQVNGLQSDLDYYRAMIEKTIVRAPFTGVLGLRQVSLGAYLSPSSVIATLQQTDSLRIDFTIPDQYSSVLHKGSVVTVVVDGLTSLREKAVILAIEPQVNVNTRNLTARALLVHSKANIGAFAKVYVEGGGDRQAIMVPTSALIPDDRASDVVTVKNGRSVYIPVTTGIRSSNLVEITHGLNPGDTIVVSGILFTRVDGPVNVRTISSLDAFK